MAITINGKLSSPAIPIKRKKSGHTKARAPQISLNEPGRLRVAHLMALFSLSHSALYARIKLHRFPEADGRDPRPFWKTDTIRRVLEG